jgi:hypothetical protein
MVVALTIMEASVRSAHPARPCCCELLVLAPSSSPPHACVCTCAYVRNVHTHIPTRTTPHHACVPLCAPSVHLRQVEKSSRNLSRHSIHRGVITGPSTASSTLVLGPKDAVPLKAALAIVSRGAAGPGLHTPLEVTLGREVNPESAPLNHVQLLPRSKERVASDIGQVNLQGPLSLEQCLAVAAQAVHQGVAVNQPAVAAGVSSSNLFLGTASEEPEKVTSDQIKSSLDLVSGKYWCVVWLLQGVERDGGEGEGCK